MRMRHRGCEKVDEAMSDEMAKMRKNKRLNLAEWDRDILLAIRVFDSSQIKRVLLQPIDRS